MVLHSLRPRLKTCCCCNKHMKCASYCIAIFSMARSFAEGYFLFVPFCLNIYNGVWGQLTYFTGVLSYAFGLAKLLLSVLLFVSIFQGAYIRVNQFAIFTFLSLITTFIHSGMALLNMMELNMVCVVERDTIYEKVSNNTWVTTPPDHPSRLANGDVYIWHFFIDGVLVSLVMFYLVLVVNSYAWNEEARHPSMSRAEQDAEALDKAKTSMASRTQLPTYRSKTNIMIEDTKTSTSSRLIISDIDIVSLGKGRNYKRNDDERKGDSKSKVKYVITD